MRRDADGSFRIGNAEVVIEQDSYVFVKSKSYRGLEVLTAGSQESGSIFHYQK